MYAHKNSAGRVINDFLNGAEIFMYLAGKTSLMQETCKMLCPCRKCKNIKFAQSETVWKHIVNREFTPHCYIWLHQREGDSRNEPSHFPSESYPQGDQMVDHDGCMIW